MRGKAQGMREEGGRTVKEPWLSERKGAGRWTRGLLGTGKKMAAKKANLTRARPEKKTRYVGVLSVRSSNRATPREIDSIIRPLLPRTELPLKFPNFRANGRAARPARRWILRGVYSRGERFRKPDSVIGTEYLCTFFGAFDIS